MTTTRVRAVCPHDCPDTCALLVSVENGVATAVRGDPHHPPTDGVLCAKVARYAQRTYDPQRLLYPLRRIGKKGEGRFERISWQQALDTIAARLTSVAASAPEAILPYSYCGTMGLVQGESMSARFFHRLGASLLDRTICAGAGATAYKYTVGAMVGTDLEQFQNAQLILIWGGNPVTSSLHFWTRAQEAKRRGARLIAIDPYRSLTAEKCHQHIALLPGTDAALALGMMHVLIAEQLIDRDYIARHTLGFEQLAQRAAQWPPRRAAEVCGISVAEVVDLARLYGQMARAGQPVAIRANYGVQRVRGGGMAVRAIACVPALVGAWRHAAGGMLLSTSGAFPVRRAALQRPDLLPGATRADPPADGAALDARMPRTINMSTIGDDLLRDASPGFGPKLQALIVYNSNPLAVAPESAKVARGFAREDLFTVVLEHFQTDTADYADIVLPATTQLEHTDVHAAYGHQYMMANNAAIAPLGEAKSNTEIFRLLAARMGFDDPCFRDSDDDLAAQAFDADDPRAAGFDWPALKRRGWQRLSVPDAPFADGGFATPSGKCEFYSARMLEDGLDPLPAYIAPYESRASNPALAARYPLAMISPPARNFLNSTFVNQASLRAAEGEPRLDLHPDDGAERGIADGDMVRIFNVRGSFTARARVTSKARPGLVVGLSLWWKKLAPDGKNANEVTSQRLTDMGRGPTFYDTLVQVEKTAG